LRRINVRGWLALWKTLKIGKIAEEGTVSNSSWIYPVIVRKPEAESIFHSVKFCVLKEVESYGLYGGNQNLHRSLLSTAEISGWQIISFK
jgi:hypothetical protein